MFVFFRLFFIPPMSLDVHSLSQFLMCNMKLFNRTLLLSSVPDPVTVTVVFATNRTRYVSTPPPPLPDIVRVSSLNILGVTVSNRLSVADHVQNVIGSCAQTLQALRLLRAHGLCDSALQTVYRAVVVARLLYAASAWWGFTTAADRQCI